MGMLHRCLPLTWMCGCVDAGPCLDEVSQAGFEVQAVRHLSRPFDRLSRVEVEASEGCVGTRWIDIKLRAKYSGDLSSSTGVYGSRRAQRQ
jgi:hypothetical protein